MMRRKIVIIDMGKISTPYCGLAETSLNFAQSLLSLHDDSLEFLFVVPQALKSEFCKQIDAKAIVPSYSGLSLLLYYLTRRKKFLCKLPEFDLYHYLHFYSPWGPSSSRGQHILLTVHDFHALGRKRAAKRLNTRIKEVNFIAFISKFTEIEYKKFFNLPKVVTRVITNGVRRPPEIDEASVNLYHEAYGDFLFTLGGLKRKNIHSLLGMMEQCQKISELQNIKLVVAGSIKDKYKNELLVEVEQRNIGNQVIFLGAIQERDKFSLLKASRAFVFPSLQEGFGLPVIEAMHFGVPVFCSNKTSLPEVGGELAYYWDNFEPGYMAKVLLDGLRDSDLQLDDGINQRKEYAQNFDWNKNAKEYIEFYKEIFSAK